MIVIVRCSPGAASFGSLLAACAGAAAGAAAICSEAFWRMATWATGSPPKGLSPNMAKPANATRIRPSATASACMPVNGKRNRRLRRAVCCPSGVLRSSAVSAIRGPESMADDTTAGRIGGRVGTPAGVADKQKGRPEDRPFGNSGCERLVRGLVAGGPLGGGLVGWNGGRLRLLVGTGLDAMQEVVGHLQRRVVLGIRRHVGLRAGLFVAVILQMTAQRG